MPYCHKASSRKKLSAVMVAAVSCLGFLSELDAAEPNAVQNEFDVEVYSQQGATIGCGLSFVAGWVNVDKQVVAAAGTLNFFASDASGIGSTIKVRATVNKKTKDLAFAWLDVVGTGDTKSFSPLVADPKGPSFSFFRKPDPEGLSRLIAAGKRGFNLGLSFAGLPLDEVARLPPASPPVIAKLTRCTNALAARTTAPNGK